MTQEPGSIQCFCGSMITAEYGTEIDALITHMMQYHTILRIVKELAQLIFAQGKSYTEGPNQTKVLED